MGLERFGKAEQNGPVDRFERQTPGAQAEGRAKTPAACYKSALTMSGCSSMVERQLPKIGDVSAEAHHRHPNSI